MVAGGGAVSDILTASQVAARYGVSRGHVYALAASGQLPCLRLGACVRFSRAALERWELASAQGQPSVSMPDTSIYAWRDWLRDGSTVTPWTPLPGTTALTAVFGPASRPGATRTKRGRRAG